MEAAMMFLHYTGPIQTGYIVPVAGCLMILGIVLGGIWSAVRIREVEGQERLAAIAKGMTPPPTPEELAIIHGRPMADATRRRDNIRRAGIVLVASAVGLILFFIALSAILQTRNVLCGTAVGLIPLAIGIGFLIDSKIQSREMQEPTDNTPAIYPPTDLRP